MKEVLNPVLRDSMTISRDVRYVPSDDIPEPKHHNKALPKSRKNKAQRKARKQNRRK